MHFSALLTYLALGASAAAQLVTSTTTASPTPSIYPNNSREFVLRTDLKDTTDPSKLRFNNLYLYSYHTGAGLNDVTFRNDKTDYVAQAWINYTSSENGQLTFNLHSPYPWTMSADYRSYVEWAPMYINAGQGGNEGYYINGTGLQWNSDYKNGLNTTFSSFGGWIVCEGAHAGAPQLYWHNKFYPFTLLCSCAEVYLCPEYL